MSLSLLLPYVSAPSQLFLWAVWTFLIAVVKTVSGTPGVIDRPWLRWAVAGGLGVAGLLVTKTLMADPVAAVMLLLVLFFVAFQNQWFQIEPRPSQPGQPELFYSNRAAQERRLNFGKRAFELKLALLAFEVLVTGWVAGRSSVPFTPPLIDFNLSPYKVSAILFLFAIVLNLIQDGTIMVRSVLEKAGTKPMDTDQKLYQFGRHIGNWERVILAVVVAAGKYEALGFLLVAKGFIRSKKFEEEAFAEYFILGTTVSIAIALAAGIMIQAWILPLWNVV